MEQLTMHIIANIHSDFPTKFGIPRQSGLVDELTAQIVFTPDYRAGSGAGAGGFLPHLAHLAVFQGGKGALVAHGSASASGGQYADGGIRHPFAVPAQCHRAQLRQALKGGAKHAGGAGAHRSWGGSHGRNADSRHQALYSLCRLPNRCHRWLYRHRRGLFIKGGVPAGIAFDGAGGSAGGADWGAAS